MDWQAAQLDEERLRTTLEALDRCKAAGASDDDLDTLARELGVRQWWTKQEKRNEMGR